MLSMGKVNSYHVRWLYSGTIFCKFEYPQEQGIFFQEFQESQINRKLQGHFKT